MKKIILALFISILSFSAAYSQMGVHFGVNGGYNSIWIQNQNNYQMSEMDYEYKFGALGGLEFGYNWANNFGMQIELNYAQMGQDYEDIMREFSEVENPLNPSTNLKVLTKRTIDLNYLQLPIMFKYMQGEKKDAIKYHMMGGAVFGYLMSAEQTYTADVKSDDNLVNVTPFNDINLGAPEFVTAGGVPPEDYFTPINLGLILDLGADVYLNDKTYLSPAFRGFYGLNDINAKETRELAPGQIENPYQASHVFYIGISLGIHWFFPDVELNILED